MAEMFQAVGVVHKMVVHLEQPVRYEWVTPVGRFCMNEALGEVIALQSLGRILCVGCGRVIKKSFQQGYCFPCFKSRAVCDVCIVKPERCHFHLGTCREPEWGLAHCMQPHIVYLADSGGLKVGITRQTQVPIRWIDQGAVCALPWIAVSSRYMAGLCEVFLKKEFNDRTHWQAMLKNSTAPVDLLEIRSRFRDHVMAEIEPLRVVYPKERFDPLFDAPCVAIQYPVLAYPQKIRSLDLDKTPEIKGRLLGIRGQYLILDSGVINVRKFTGYEVRLTVGERRSRSV